MATFSGPEQMGESPFRKINIDNVVVQMKFKLKLGHHSLILYFRLLQSLLFMHGPYMNMKKTVVIVFCHILNHE